MQDCVILPPVHYLDLGQQSHEAIKDLGNIWGFPPLLVKVNKE